MHLTRHIDGEVLVGPTALMVGARDAYRLRRVAARPRRDARLARHVADGAPLVADRRSPRCATPPTAAAFVRAAQRYVPELEPGDVSSPARPASARRPSARDGRSSTTSSSPTPGRALHVRNAPSPAATSSLAIARLIADRAEEAFGLFTRTSNHRREAAHGAA